ncbi:Asp-tRNA(Asn)/Glu-tRNA(Gln) amidotransferase subunit GatC [Candidatus Peregrinibacteria bacterium]|nr:Asp-tRNA(Asn)/Glu-tRNA(Gln) amidotransferase subunit GatC [Candidatus Peregrinibacteria bacterium]
MAPLTTDRVRHIAKLARLTLTDAEVERSVQELPAVLRLIDLLREVETKGVVPTAQVNSLTNVLREDALGSSRTSPDALLSCSPLPIAQHQIQTPSAHG